MTFFQGLRRLPPGSWWLFLNPRDCPMYTATLRGPYDPASIDIKPLISSSFESFSLILYDENNGNRAGSTTNRLANNQLKYWPLITHVGKNKWSERFSKSEARSFFVHVKTIIMLLHFTSLLDVIAIPCLVGRSVCFSNNVGTIRFIYCAFEWKWIHTIREFFFASNHRAIHIFQND